MCPPEQVSTTIEISPDLCPKCGGNEFSASPAFTEVRQVVELPETPVEVTQFNIHTCACGTCGTHVRAEIPPEAARGFGPRLMGFITLLAGDTGTTKRKIQSLAGYLGIKISLGSVANIHKLAGKVLEQPREDVRNTVLASENVNADETSWRLYSKRCWMWIAATPSATCFTIDQSRSQEAFQRIFGDFDKTLITDRYGAYNSHQGDKQACLAHIDRDFTKVSERDGADGAVGRILKQELNTVFEMWGHFKDGYINRAQLQQQTEEPKANIKLALKIGAGAEDMRS